MKVKMLLKLLKRKLPKSKETSLNVYVRALKRLYRLKERKEKENDVPTTFAWLASKSLRAAYEKLPVNQRRHLSSAAHVYTKATDNMGDRYWEKRMFKDQDSYRDVRKQNKKTKKEEFLWIDEGLKKLKQASTEFKRAIAYKLKAAPSIPNLWLYTQYLLMRFYSEVTLRNTLASVELSSRGKNNYLKRSKGRFVLVMRTFKASDKIGEREIVLSSALSRVLVPYIKYRSKLELKHDHLLSNSSGGELSAAGLGKSLRKLTADKLGKKVGVRMLRLFKATDNRALIEKVSKLSNDMLHTRKQTTEYVRK